MTRRRDPTTYEDSIPLISQWQLYVNILCVLSMGHNSIFNSMDFWCGPLWAPQGEVCKYKQTVGYHLPAERSIWNSGFPRSSFSHGPDQDHIIRVQLSWLSLNSKVALVLAPPSSSLVAPISTTRTSWAVWTQLPLGGRPTRTLPLLYFWLSEHCWC